MQTEQIPSIEQLRVLASKATNSGNKKNGMISEIVPHCLYVGNKAASKDLKLLQNLQVGAIVNVGAGKCLFDSITYLKIGAQDKEDEDMLQHFLPASHFIDEQLQDGKRVLVHCQGGMCRSPCIAAAFLIYKYSIGVQESIDIVTSARPKCKIRKEFVQALENFAGIQQTNQ